MDVMKKGLILLLVIILNSCDTRDSITKFSEDNYMEKEYYVYPSTLRMINLEQNEEYNDFIKDLKKGRFFSISNNAKNQKLIEKLKSDMANEGFEEGLTYQEKEIYATVYIKDESRGSRIAAIIEKKTDYNIIDIEGMVNLTKLPEMIKIVDEGELLNIIDITEKDRKKHRVEHHSPNEKPN